MTGTDLQAEIEKAIQLLEEDIAAAVAEERAAVVAYLRTRPGYGPVARAACTILPAASAVVRPTISGSARRAAA